MRRLLALGAIGFLGSFGATGADGAPAKPVAKGSAKVPAARPTPAAQAAPVARYAMDVGTTTGLAAMGAGMGSMMSMALGRGGSREARELQLRLGSSRAAAGGAPKADHFFLPPARLGKSVPLLTPEKVPPSPEEETRERTPEQFRRPKGRMLIFWGCGERAAKGQPVIIDFAKLAAGQLPPNLFSVRVPVDRGVAMTNSATYGEWPNRSASKPPPKDSSLIGAHRIAGNYSPEINFTLAQNYMPGLIVKSAAAPGGGVALSWSPVAAATGYYAWTFGAATEGNEAKDLVWWSSSMTREFGGGLWDWLPPATVARLVAERVVLPPTATSCTIPAEVKAAAPGFMMGNMNAYGPEANFAFPPRPATGPWRPEWTARVRFRSNTSFFIGGPGGMGAMGAMEGADESEDAPKPKKCRGGLLGAALGVC